MADEGPHGPEPTDDPPSAAWNPPGTSDPPPPPPAGHTSHPPGAPPPPPPPGPAGTPQWGEGPPPPPGQPQWGQPPPAAQLGWGQASVTPALRPVSGIATAATVMLALMALSGAIGAVLDFAYAGAIDDFLNGDGSLQDAIDAEDARNGFVLLSLAAQVATAVVFLVWQARVRRNSDALGAGPHRYGHALSVGCWFIPFANLVMPKIVLNDLWRATDPRTPSAYRIEGRPVGSVVNWWWALWIIGGALGGSFALQDPGDTLEELENFAGTVRIGGVLSLVGIAAAVLGIVVVRRITERQQQRARLFGLPAA